MKRLDEKKIMDINFKSLYFPLTVTSTYILLGILWILFSDKVLFAMVKSQERFYQYSVYKGWAFILISSFFLYILIKRYTNAQRSLSEDLIRNIKHLEYTENRLNEKVKALLQAEEQKTESDERYKLVLEGVGAGIWEYNILDTRYDFSAKFFEILGCPPDLGSELMCTRLEDILHPNEKDWVLQELNDYLFKRVSFYQSEFRLRNFKGEYIWVSSFGKAIWHDDNPVRMVGSIIDITVSKLDQNKIVELAYYDKITKLPNRAKIEEYVNKWIETHSEPIALVYLDIDNFKMINDAIGHNLGDEILFNISNELKKVSPGAHMLSRISGDEFCFIFTAYQSKDHLSLFSEDILSIIRKPWKINDREFYITGSIGISTGPEHGDSFDVLLKKADTAMYVSKNDGRNRYTFFHEKLHDDVLEYVEIQSRMKRALDNDEFILYYQPQFALDSHELIGAEALIRWQTIDRGIIPPDRFISIAEKTGFITTLGLWVIETVFKHHNQWQDKGYSNLTLSINLSAVQIMDPDLIPKVEALVKKYTINTKQFTFEITENVAIDYSQTTMEKLNALRRLGFSIALDDFGINYSSLSYLRRLPIDYLKLDKTFVSQIDENEKDMAISRSVIYMAHQINLKVVAEGIEIEEHFNILKALNCDFGQGYLFDKPLPDQVFEDLYLRNYH